MLDKIFESLDDKVFTTDLKESLTTEFEVAVEEKAASIAETRIEEEIESLNEKSEQHIEMLDEKAEEYVELKQAEMVESLDKYLDRIVEEFVSEAKDALTESIKNEKADMIIEAFDSMIVATGVKLAQIVEAKDNAEVDNKLEESISKYDALVEENIALEEENKDLAKCGIIAEMKDGLSLVESDKFEKLAGIVEFSKDEVFVQKLETIKESVKGTAEVNDKDLTEAAKNEDQSKAPSWAHLV